MDDEFLLECRSNDGDDVQRKLRWNSECFCSGLFPNTLQVSEIKCMFINKYKHMSVLFPNITYRSMALSLVFMFGRIGAVIGSNIVAALLESHCEWIFGINAILLVGEFWNLCVMCNYYVKNNFAFISRCRCDMFSITKTI